MDFASMHGINYSDELSLQKCALVSRWLDKSDSNWETVRLPQLGFRPLWPKRNKLRTAKTPPVCLCRGTNHYHSVDSSSQGESTNERDNLSKVNGRRSSIVKCSIPKHNRSRIHSFVQPLVLGSGTICHGVESLLVSFTSCSRMWITI